MAKRRLIPKLQLTLSEIDPSNFALVNTVKFSKIIEIGNPVSQAKIYEAQLADELILLNLSPSKGCSASDANNLEMTLEAVSREVFLPLTVGGGIKKIEDIARLLAHGADKISINTGAIDNPILIEEAARAFGSQCVVVSIDYKRNSKGVAEVYTNGGVTPTGLDPLQWALRAEKLGAGEVLLTSIDNDGMRCGLDTDVAGLLSKKLSVPLIISGGCGLASHFVEGFSMVGADGVAAGTFFSFRDQNPMQTRSHIKNAGIDIRTASS